MSILEAAQTGDRRRVLMALRDKLAETLDSKDSARDIASNSKRLMEVLAEIESLPVEEAKSPLDKARRKGKR